MRGRVALPERLHGAPVGAVADDLPRLDWRGGRGLRRQVRRIWVEDSPATCSKQTGLSEAVPWCECGVALPYGRPCT